MMAGVFERLPELVNANAALVRRGRFLTVTFLLQRGDTPYLVRVVEGRIDRVERGPFLMRDWRFAIRASEDAWRKFAEPVPAAGYHDVFAMAKLGHAVIEGDLLVLMQNLHYVQHSLAMLRWRAHGGSDARSPQPPHRSEGVVGGDRAETATGNGGFEPVLGRYVWLTVGGRRCRVYFEEAGPGVAASGMATATGGGAGAADGGIPLVCLHTAGADNKQWRHLLNDADVTRHFRVLAFDMPRHGKSLPPVGWQDEEYRLTTDAYVETILAFCDALALERPVVLGCSIGGKIVLHLALRHPERFRALIGLEAADYQAPWYDDTSWLHRPDVHGGEVCSALMSGLIAPQSPGEARWETLWGYAQGGPGVFRGDLHFYRAEGDLRGKLDAIDTRRCPLYLLTGEYDFSCTPDDTRRTAASIEGARVTVMHGLGHFPMSEDPARFRQYLLPVLDDIRAHAPRP
jgi:pimeloyl-ACP methyl ester carboxylesterase